MRLAAGNRVRREARVSGEVALESCQAQRQICLLELALRGDAHLDVVAQEVLDDLSGSLHWFQFALKGDRTRVLIASEPASGKRTPQLGLGATYDITEQQALISPAGLGERCGKADRGELAREDAVRDHLAVHENPVAIENDEV